MAKYFAQTKKMRTFEESNARGTCLLCENAVEKRRMIPF